MSVPPLNLFIVYMCLPVWRESKQVRLICELDITELSTCAFPFGGNRNLRVIPLVGSPVKLSTCAFPFGGNRNVAPGLIRNTSKFVYMCLPVWRESKQGGRGGCIPPLRFYTSTCAFPFGGNRNIIHFNLVGKLAGSLHVPSRLEGIETFRTRDRYRSQERCVYMCLPVWRESKLRYRS